MSYYFIDFENTTEQGLDGIETLSEKDEVHILYSKSAEKLRFRYCEKLVNTKAHIKMYEVDVGSPNALDFQLVTLLGFMVNKNTEENVEYFIVSKDHGYDCVTSFWKKQKGIKAFRIEKLKDKSAVLNGERVPSLVKTDTIWSKSAIEKWLKQRGFKRDISIISSAIIAAETKCELNILLCKQLENQKVSGILKKLRPLFTGNNMNKNIFICNK